jgi:hypothetical protein
MGESGRVRVVADLRVTDSNDIRRGYPFGALKSVILSETILVGSAGNAELAMHTLRRLPAQPARVDDVLPLLAESSATAGSGNAAVDYLVAVAREGIWRVTHQGVHESARTGWIGDARAFVVFQRGYHETPVSEPIVVPGISSQTPLPVSKEELEESLRMANGILRLELDDSIDTVGEAFISAVSPRAGGFRYEQQAMLTADHEQIVTGGEWIAADWGTVAEGGFGYSTLVPVEPGIGMLGLYFPHAGLGLLYHPLCRDDPFVYARVTHTQFRARVLDAHGVALHGPGVG